MKVILATPNFHQARGNTITVQRIANKLSNLGVDSEIVSITEDHQVTSLPSADLVHGFNAFRFYHFKEKLNHKIKQYVVTMTGTDLNHDLFDKNNRQDVIQSITEAKAIHVFNKQAKEVLIKEVPSVADKIYIIPQGTSTFYDTSYFIPKGENTFLFVLPAGIRKVKNVPFAINALKILQENHPHIRLIIVGPIIENEEGHLVQTLVERNKDWVQYLGQVPHTSMFAIYQKADVLLNTSISEGQSTAIIEGMTCGIPVLVSENQGNISLVKHGQTGLVYRSQSEFIDYAELLVNNNEIREKLGDHAQEYILKYHSNTSEAEMLLQMYKDVL